MVTEPSSINLLCLKGIAKALVANDKGLLAMDESNPTCNERFAKLGIPQTVESRRLYRQLLLTTPELGQCISGVILYDETLHQRTSGDLPFIAAIISAGIIPGIKVDLGKINLAGHPGEMATQGIDGLGVRLEQYRQLGARFAKWRAVFSTEKGLPTEACIEANAQDLARYAAVCQSIGLVPIVEPEVLMAGEHSMERCEAVTEQVLRAVFSHLVSQGVSLEAMLLKPNMVLAGVECAYQPTVDEVAEATTQCLLRTVPAAVPGVLFLSGGQTPELASERLNAMNVRSKGLLPWALGFSYARAIQQPAMETWGGNPNHVLSAQRVLFHRANCNRAARRGDYRPEMEVTAANANNELVTVGA